MSLLMLLTLLHFQKFRAERQFFFSLVRSNPFIEIFKSKNQIDNTD